MLLVDQGYYDVKQYNSSVWVTPFKVHLLYKNCCNLVYTKTDTNVDDRPCALAQLKL